MIDISTQIMYDKAIGEQKILTMSNAMVSHEIRNPLNSIYSQNIKLRLLIERSEEQIDEI